MKVIETPSAVLQQFRVYRHWTATYTVDVTARDSSEAIALADNIEFDAWRFHSEGWRDERADRLPYDQFEPPTLPAIKWTAPAKTPTYREAALSATSLLQS